MKVLATLPTYNEAGNIVPLVNEILDIDPHMEVLVVDDDSPDRTWRLVREHPQFQTRLHLIHRANERGRGTAGIAAFIFARDKDYDAAIEMDADFSHHPRFIPSLLQPIRDGEVDIVVGSRLVQGGGETGRHPARRWITMAANLYIRTLLKLRIRDCTSGFRAFSRTALQSIPWERLDATGPEIVQEVLLEARRADLKMTERPILFEERREGTSTFNYRIMLNSFRFVWRNR